MSELAKPDWDDTGTTRGPGSIKEIPEPRVRFYPRPDGKPRGVHISIYSWAGYAPGASHFYVDIEPDGNYVWDGRKDSYHEKGTWRRFYDDPYYQEDELKLRNRFSHKSSANRWIKQQLERYFDGWEVRMDDRTSDIDRRPYVYKREGD